MAPSPPLSALTDDSALAQFAPPSTGLALIAQTRLSLAALQKLRRGARRYTPPDEVRPPGVLQRHSLAWILWIAFAVFAYIKVVVTLTLTLTPTLTLTLTLTRRSFRCSHRVRTSCRTPARPTSG